MHKKSDYAYELPAHLIAQRPLPERTASRMLYLDGVTGRREDLHFTDFPSLLRPNDVLVFNDTRVLPARLYGRKNSGGRVEILIERILDERHAWVHIRASKAPKAGVDIILEGGYACRVMGREDDLFLLAFENEDRPLLAIVEEIGHIPLPPYITRADHQEDRERYQTVFARRPGAVAAPTAGLHFDQVMVDRLDAMGIARVHVTLHVGSGTFQPVRVENLAEHRLHSEYCEVGEEAVAQIEAARSRSGRVIAIGTTSVRSLETAAASGRLSPFRGETRLFIRPGFRFHCVDALLTNFHLPESTLLALVCAFGGYETMMAAYRHAVDSEYRFFSYGDAMFVTRKPA